MNKKNIAKLIYRNALGALTIGVGAIAVMDTPATAAPIEADFRLAQVGVHSRVSSPTPLNLRPRTHTPLPQSNYSRHPSHNRQYNRGYSHSDRYEYESHPRNRRHREHSNRRRRGNQGRVIIISPGGSYRSRGSYGSYSNGGYIRVIGN